MSSFYSGVNSRLQPTGAQFRVGKRGWMNSPVVNAMHFIADLARVLPLQVGGSMEPTQMKCPCIEKRCSTIEPGTV